MPISKAELNIAAHEVLNKHLPPGCIMREITRRPTGDNPASFDWNTEYPDTSKYVGIIYIHTDGSYTLLIKKEYQLQSGWSFVQRREEGSVADLMTSKT